MTDDSLPIDLARSRLSKALSVDSPFPWQLELLERFIKGQTTSAIDVPTGLGKTAVMAIWLVARAAGAELPRRLVYVVDRRAVVDQATDVAERLREWVDTDSAMRSALELQGPLPISTLRGKHIDNREWLADPSVPAIILGTVDMIGSRLLFEGYGVSRKMRPYHAGLLGADSLIVLDEAHLVPPFERLIEGIASGRDARGRIFGALGDGRGVVPPMQFLSLSATGRNRRDALMLGEADRLHPIVAERLRAKKRTWLRDEVSARELPQKLVEEAWAVSRSGATPIRCIVFCSGRDDAQKVRDGLLANARKLGDGRIDVELFVGSRRVFEREQAATWLERRGFLAGTEARPERPTYVVATSAGEVGVDLDADHMVCDLVPWERMIQRLGRVNRRGRGDAQVVIVPAGNDKPDVKSRVDAVRRALAELPRIEDGSIDASPGAITALKARAADDEALAQLLEQASTPAPLHSPLTRATLEAWSMTSVDEHPGRPQAAPWIRGWIEDEEPQTTVVWRRHLPITDAQRLFEKRDLDAFRSCAEPHLAERLETETWRVVEWLDARLKVVLRGADSMDVEGAQPFRRTDVVALILNGAGETRLLKGDDLSNKDKRNQVERALVGSTLIVDARVGGLCAGLLSAASDEASDVTEIDGPERVVPFRIRRVVQGQLDPVEPTAWRVEARFAIAESEENEIAWLLVESAIDEAAESEEGRSVGAKRKQLLEEHQSWAEKRARALAVRLALPKPYAEMLAVAARLHDEGKRARRWQRAFGADADGVYAKTTSRPNLQLLAGYRHELGSLPYAERSHGLQTLDEPLRELCLHLIAAHHGSARPLIRTDGAEEPPTRLVLRSQQIALRFAALERQWGPWGLAWWESLLRAADQQASRDNDCVEAKHG